MQTKITSTQKASIVNQWTFDTSMFINADAQVVASEMAESKARNHGNVPQ